MYEIIELSYEIIEFTESMDMEFFECHVSPFHKNKTTIDLQDLSTKYARLVDLHIFFSNHQVVINVIFYKLLFLFKTCLQEQ